jgi:hypothetical protein
MIRPGHPPESQHSGSSLDSLPGRSYGNEDTSTGPQTSSCMNSFRELEGNSAFSLRGLFDTHICRHEGREVDEARSERAVESTLDIYRAILGKKKYLAMETFVLSLLLEPTGARKARMS